MVSQSGQSGLCQLVVFRLKGEEFALDIASVREIVRAQRLTPVPLTPPFILGLTNLRGQIIPVVDVRLRLGLEASAIDDRSRLLVVELEGHPSGLLVDEVREVLTVGEEAFAPPPSLGGSFDGLVARVAKPGGGRMIQVLDLNRLLPSLEERPETAGGSLGSFGVDQFESSGNARAAEEERRLLSFFLGSEEYAFEIDHIQEIIRFEPPQEVPEAPAYLRGIISLRGTVLPVYDLRRLLGLPPLVDEKRQKVAHLRQIFENWLKELTRAMASGGDPPVLDPERCLLGQWLKGELEKCRSETELEIVHQLHLRHRHLHSLVRAYFTAASDDIADEIYLLTAQMKDLFQRLEAKVDKAVAEEERIIILNVSGTLAGVLVDQVQEVLAVPVEPLERTELEDLKAIVRIDQGRRIVFVLDKEAVVPTEPLEDLAEGGESMNTSDVVEFEEEQLVTFFLDDEEYAFPIIQIQEINRPGEISRVPKTPAYVEGVTNLRGEVIPVIDLRKRFGLPPRSWDDRTRLIIIQFGEQKVGLVVDRVNEVTRLPKQRISPPPALLLSQIDLRFVSAVAQREGGGLIIILDVNQIFSSEEQEELKEMVFSEEEGVTAPDERPRLKIAE